MKLNNKLNSLDMEYDKQMFPEHNMNKNYKPIWCH